MIKSIAIGISDAYQQEYTASRLIKVDPNSGVPAATWNWPSTTGTQIAGCTIPGGSYSLAPGSGPISVGPDGTYYLTVSWSNTVSWPAPTIDSVNDCDDMTTDSGTVTTSQLMAISPAGSVSTTNLPNPANGRPIPDGNGGTLVQIPIPPSKNQGQQALQVMDVGGSNGSATISNFAGGDMVLGDQATYFTTDGNQIVDVDEASGNELWSWQPESGSVQIIAATAGGGVAVKNIVGSQEDVVRLDASGNPTYDTWGTAGGSAGYGVVSNSSYSSNGLWIGTTGDPVISGIMGNDLLDALSPWGWGSGEGQGDKQGQAESDPALKLQATADCTIPDPASSKPQIYYRNTDFKLVDKYGNTIATSLQYTVYEQLDNFKSSAKCKKNGNYTGMSPCEPADGSEGNPYNVFYDSHSLELQTAPAGGMQFNQSFLYGLKGQRLWEVHEIDRWGGRGNSVTVPVAKKSSMTFLLQNLSQPLIDGYGYPYLAPAYSPVRGTGANCNGQPPQPPLQ